jgi:hypothetical protein
MAERPELSDEDKRALAKRVRDNIVKTAEKYIGSQAWIDAATRRNYPADEILTEAGASPGLPNGRLWGSPPLAGQWADPSYAIPGWEVLTPAQVPEPGDVLAQQIGYSDASGHVMIVGGDNTVIGTGTQGNGPEGTIESIPMPKDLTNQHPCLALGPMVFRRWVGQ